MKNIFLTFDYELFFGEDSGSLENSILKPTDLLLDTLNKCNLQATFYIDTIYIEKLLEHNLLDAYEKVKKQIQKIVLEGHRAELHLHPHWYDAIYLPGTERWNFPTYEHYRLHSYSVKEIENIFDRSVEILYTIIHEVDVNYRFYSYRAGGWCIQPFDIIKPFVEKHRIFVDSSVVCDMHYESSAQFFDFRNSPKKSFYKFSDNPIIEAKNGQFIEIPSSVISMNFFEKFLNKLTKKFTDNLKYGDGKGIPIKIANKTLERLKKSNKVITLDDISSYLIKYFINKISSDTIVFLSHPKFLSNDSFKIIHKISKKNNFRFKSIINESLEI